MNKKYWYFIMVAVISAIVITACIVAVSIPNKSKNIKDIYNESIFLRFGDTYDLKFCSNAECKEFVSNVVGIVRKDGNKLKTLSCGETQISYKVDNKSINLKVKVYAESVSFDSQNIKLYTNGLSTQNLNLLVNNIPYTADFECRYDSDIISYDGESVQAKNLGHTTIVANILGKEKDITAKADIDINKCGYLKSVDISNINLVQNQVCELPQISFFEGEKTEVKYTTNNDNVSIKDNYIIANKVGKTLLTVQGEVQYSKLKTYEIEINIEKLLELNNYTFYKNGTVISKLMCNKMADEKFSEYELRLVYNKKINKIPTICGINILRTQIENNIAKVFFEKENTLPIIATIFDINKSEIKNNCNIEMGEYLQKIDYKIDRRNLHCINSEYKLQADKDNIFSDTAIQFDKNALDIECSAGLKYDNDKICAIAKGAQKVCLKAKDGSNLIKEIAFDVKEVLIQNVEIDITSVFLEDTFSIKSQIIPIYAHCDLEFVCDNNYIMATKANYFVAKKIGIGALKAQDKLSEYAKEFAIKIDNAPLNLVEVNGEQKDIVNMKLNESIIVMTHTDNFEYKIFVENKQVQNQNMVIVNKWSKQLNVGAKSLGELIIKFYENGKLFAILKIIIEKSA